jgi:hypothetical protein
MKRKWVGGRGWGWGNVRNKSEIDEPNVWMKVMYGEIRRAGRPKQGITLGQNYWPWQYKQRQRSHEGVRAGMTQEKRSELCHYGMWSSSRSKGGSKPPCFKFSTTGRSTYAWVGKECRAVDRRERERASEARLPWICRGRDEARGERGRKTLVLGLCCLPPSVESVFGRFW